MLGWCEEDWNYRWLADIEAELCARWDHEHKDSGKVQPGVCVFHHISAVCSKFLPVMICLCHKMECLYIIFLNEKIFGHQSK